MPADSGNQYEYVAPLTSPLYRHVFKPVCVWLCDNVVPTFVTPWSITLTGLALVVYATYLVIHGHHALAGVLWSTYGMLDNLDGCQARKTGTSSQAGEFLDHAVDSLVSSLASVVMMRSLFDVSTPEGASFVDEWQAAALAIAGNLPFWLGCWAHHVVGRLMIGPSFHGSDFFTVDEFNILFVPGILIVRGVTPGFWDTIVAADITIGFCLFVAKMLVSVVLLVVVAVQLLQRSSFRASAVLLAPLSAWVLAAFYLDLTIPVKAATFSAMAIEVIVLRFGVHSRGTTRYLWWPALLATGLHFLPEPLTSPEILGLAWLLYIWNYYLYLVRKSAKGH